MIVINDILNTITDNINSILDITNSIEDIMNCKPFNDIMKSISDIINSILDILNWIYDIIKCCHLANVFGIFLSNNSQIILWYHEFTIKKGNGSPYGEGVFYFKLMNKTSWQEHFGKYRVLWSLHYARIRHWNWFGFSIKNVLLCSS